MPFKNVVRRYKVSSKMFASTFNTGRSAPTGATLVNAQRIQSLNYALMSIKVIIARRHHVGIRYAREIIREQISDYRMAISGNN